MRIYKLFLASIVALIIANWIWSYNPRVSELNDLLSKNIELINYPYKFKVISVENGRAIMSSPRSPEVSVLIFISIIKPELEGMNPDSPEVIAVQKELAEIQSKAKKIILNQDDINSVSWEIDKLWFADHGVSVW